MSSFWKYKNNQKEVYNVPFLTIKDLANWHIGDKVTNFHTNIVQILCNFWGYFSKWYFLCKTALAILRKIGYFLFLHLVSMLLDAFTIRARLWIETLPTNLYLPIYLLPTSNFLPSIYLPTVPIIYLPTYLPSIYLPYLSSTNLNLFTFSLPTHLTYHLPTYLFTFYLSTYRTYHLPTSTYLPSLYLPTLPIIYLPTYLPSIYLPTVPIIYLPVPIYVLSIYLPTASKRKGGLRNLFVTRNPDSSLFFFLSRLSVCSRKMSIVSTQSHHSAHSRPSRSWYKLYQCHIQKVKKLAFSWEGHNDSAATLGRFTQCVFRTAFSRCDLAVCTGFFCQNCNHRIAGKFRQTFHIYVRQYFFFKLT